MAGDLNGVPMVLGSGLWQVTLGGSRWFLEGVTHLLMNARLRRFTVVWTMSFTSSNSDARYRIKLQAFSLKSEGGCNATIVTSRLKLFTVVWTEDLILPSGDIRYRIKHRTPSMKNAGDPKTSTFYSCLGVAPVWRYDSARFSYPSDGGVYLCKTGSFLHLCGYTIPPCFRIPLMGFPMRELSQSGGTCEAHKEKKKTSTFTSRWFTALRSKCSTAATPFSPSSGFFVNFFGANLNCSGRVGPGIYEATANARH